MFAFITSFTSESIFMVVGLVFALTIATSVYLANVFVTKHTGATTYISVLVVFFIGALVALGGYPTNTAGAPMKKTTSTET